ncbi:MAG: hypothetical protein ACRENL_10345, partial [Candidatus Dormibacteria bacterium]
GDQAADAPQDAPGPPGSIPPREPAGWNAFGASSYPVEAATPDRPPSVDRRTLGRHSRAVARERIPLASRVWGALAGTVAAMRAHTRTASAGARRGVSGMSRANPSSRLYVVIAAVGVIFVGALLISHIGHPTTALLPRPAPTAATHPRASASAPSPTAPAQSSAPAATAPAVAAAQTFGSGAVGYHVIRLRYGAQVGYMRVVFDLGAPVGQGPGSPKVAVSFSSPRTMLVTFTGALATGSWRPPPAGNVIASVTLVSSASDRSVYRFELTHAVTTTGFYLAAPTRFVLDLH